MKAKDAIVKAARLHRLVISLKVGDMSLDECKLAIGLSKTAARGEMKGMVKGGIAMELVRARVGRAEKHMIYRLTGSDEAIAAYIAGATVVTEAPKQAKAARVEQPGVHAHLTADGGNRMPYKMPQHTELHACFFGREVAP